MIGGRVIKFINKKMTICGKARIRISEEKGITAKEKEIEEKLQKIKE